MNKRHVLSNGHVLDTKSILEKMIVLRSVHSYAERHSHEFVHRSSPVKILASRSRSSRSTEVIPSETIKEGI